MTQGGRPVDVSAREFALLAALLERPGAALSKAQLEERIYRWGDEVESNAVEVHIHNLRKKLGSRGDPHAARRRLCACVSVGPPPMSSIRRTLLAWLLAGLAAIALAASSATYVAARREVGELLDLQLKQLAYSTRIDDLLRGRRPASTRATSRTRRASPSSSRRSGIATACSSTGRSPGMGLPVPATEGYSTVSAGRPRLAGLHARAGDARAAGRAGAGRARGDRHADGAAHARAVRRADPAFRRC